MNWGERINRAIKRGRFLDEERELALSYATCAVGERIAQLRGHGIEPSMELVEGFNSDGHDSIEVPTNKDVRWAAVMFFADVEGAGRGDYGGPECALRQYNQIQAWDGS